MKPETTEPPALRVLRHPIVVLASVAGGVLLGLFAAKVGLALAPAGQIYLLLLEMTVLPIVMLAIMGGVASLVQRSSGLRLAARAVLVLLLFFLAAGALGLAVTLLARPGAGMPAADTAALSRVIRLSPQGADLTVSLSDPVSPRSRGSLIGLLAGIVPRNIFASLSAGTILQAMLFSVLVGIAIGLLREKQRDYLLGLARGGLAAFRAVNRWLIHLLPVGAVCLVASRLAAADTTLLPVLARLLLTLAACVGSASLLLVIVQWRASGRSLRRTVSALVEPLAYAFVSGSSMIALPYSLRALEEKLGFRSERLEATLPIVTALARYGTMLAFVLSASFVAGFYGVSWSTADQPSCCSSRPRRRSPRRERAARPPSAWWAPSSPRSGFPSSPPW